MATSGEPYTEIGDLLSQFKSMGTTDRETLVQELFSLLDGQISRNQCAFVLEMSNWNLQNAVGTFYDYLGFNPAECFSMKVEGTDFEPQGPIMTGQRFTLTWMVVNTGSTTWPDDTQLVYHSGYHYNGILEGPVGRVSCGERKMITVSIFCPSVPGFYCTQMRLRYEGGYFGEILPIKIQAVESNGIACLTNQLSLMTTAGYNKEETDICRTLEFHNDGPNNNDIQMNNNHSSADSCTNEDVINSMNS